MNKLTSRLSNLLIISTIILSTFNAYGKASEFHGVKCRNVTELENLEKMYPQLTATWVEVKKMRVKSQDLPYVFGTTARPVAEKEYHALLAKYKTIQPKYQKLSEKYQKELSTDIEKTKKKLAPLKNPSSATLKKRKIDLQAQLAEQKTALATLKKISKLSTMYVAGDIQRLRTKCSSQARTHLEKKYPAMVTLRMQVQDNIGDIERVTKKDPATLTATDKKNLQKAEMKLKSNYKKLMAMVAVKQKSLSAQEVKLNKSLDAINLKIKKAEKANRKTDKLDEQYTTIMVSRNLLTAELLMIDNLTITPKAVKLIAGK